MAVIGRNSCVIENTGRNVNVKPFTSDCKTLENVPIVDAVLKWYDEYNDKVHILMVKNALYVPTMPHNLIPPFIMCKAGVVVNDIPKIHVDNPGIEDHTLYFPNDDVRIQLRLN